MKKTLYILKKKGVDISLVEKVSIRTDSNGLMWFEIDNSSREMPVENVLKIVLDDKVIFEVGEFYV